MKRTPNYSAKTKRLATFLLSAGLFVLLPCELFAAPQRPSRGNDKSNDDSSSSSSSNSHNAGRSQPAPRVTPPPPSPPPSATSPSPSSSSSSTARATRPEPPTSNVQRPSASTSNQSSTSNRRSSVNQHSSDNRSQANAPPARNTPTRTSSSVENSRDRRSNSANSNQRASENNPASPRQTRRSDNPQSVTIATVSIANQPDTRRSSTRRQSSATNLAPQTSASSTVHTIEAPRRQNTSITSVTSSVTTTTTTSTPNRVSPHVREQRGSANHGNQSPNDRDSIRENGYNSDADVARTVYRDSRRQAERAAEQRRDRHRNEIRKPDRHHDGHNDHRHASYDRHHRHTHNCGHYYYNNRWHDFAQSHRHHDGCGHHFHSGLWISFSLGHVHGHGCGHFFDDGIWLSHTGSLHYHHAGCGHYYYDGIWNNSSCYHIHGPGCGHYNYNGRWHDFAQSHAHSEYCGHVYDGSNWVIVNTQDHVHNANCGHYQFANSWYAYPREYYTMGRADSFYFFVDLGDYRNRNLSESTYQRFLAANPQGDIFRSHAPLAKAYSAFAKGSYYDSLVQFKLAGEREPDNALIYLARAQAQIAVKDYRAAFEDIKTGMEILPEWADAYINLSETYSRSEDLALHTQQLEDWVQRYPRDFKAHFVLGYFYYFHQEYDAAKNELIYALSWDETLEPAQNLMDHILSFDAESEIVTRDLDLPPTEEIETTTE